MEKLQFIQTTPQQLQDAIIEGIKIHLEEIKEHIQLKTPTKYISRSDLAESLDVNLSTIHNWTKKGKLKSYGLGGKVYYKWDEVEEAIVKL